MDWTRRESSQSGLLHRTTLMVMTLENYSPAIRMWPSFLGFVARVLVDLRSEPSVERSTGIMNSAKLPFDPGLDRHKGCSTFQVLVQPREMVLNEVHPVFAPIQFVFDYDRWGAKHAPFASEIC